MQSKQGIIITIIALVVIGGGAAAYFSQQGGSSTSGDTTTTSSTDKGSGIEAAEATNKVTIENFAFGPKDIKIKAGDTVTWTNQDTTEHNVVSQDGSPEEYEGKLLNDGESYERTYDKPGTYEYYCGPHPNMQGTVYVTEA